MARVGDLFPEYEKYDWVKGEGNLKQKYGKRNKCGVARGVFHTFMNLLMDDLVEGVRFKFPSYKAMMYIEEIPDEISNNLKAKGKLEGFENAFVSKPYAPTYRFTSNNGDRHKFRVIFDKKRYHAMLRKLNEGKTYSGNIGIW